MVAKKVNPSLPADLVTGPDPGDMSVRKSSNQVFSRFYRPVDTGIVFIEPTRTQQHFQRECDINWIVERYQKTGHIDKSVQEYYADVSGLDDYRQAHEMITEAQEAFMGIPARVRLQFDNDPARFESWIVQNPEQAIQAGFLVPRTDPSPGSPGVGPVSSPQANSAPNSAPAESK